MTGTENETEAVRVYLRTLAEVAQDRVLAAAEDVITAVWVGELEQVRRGVLESAESLDGADRAAREALRQAQERGDPGAMATAQARLSKAAEDLGTGLLRMRLVVEAVDTELEHARVAAIERTRREREKSSRLRAAWSAAYGS